MRLFHKLGFYFGDYKPENFLVTFEGSELKIGDFGMAMMIKVGRNNYPKGGTPKWCLEWFWK